MLCTLLGLTGGRASVAGFVVTDQADEVRLRIGIALQDAALDPKQSGRELLRLQARLYRPASSTPSSRSKAWSMASG
jgi:ABC-2 type transport system ATP-binding protein